MSLKIYNFYRKILKSRGAARERLMEATDLTLGSNT